MTLFLLFLLELLLLFITSRFIFQALFIIFYLITRHKKTSFVLLSVLFFPGVVIHELSHLFMAEILRVKTHGMEFVPEYEDGRLKMGSVRVEKTDFLRSFIIGIAPFVVGISVLTLSTFFLFQTFTYKDIFSSYFSFIVTLLITYLFFSITNTMFSSKKDLDGAVELLIIFIVIFILLFILKINLYSDLVSFLRIKNVQDFIKRISILLTIPLAINIFAVLITFPFVKKFFPRFL